MNPTSLHRVLAGTAAVAGLLAALAGSPFSAPPPGSIDIRRIAKEVIQEKDHVTALELARWIKDRKAGLRVVDLRSPAEFDDYHVPSAMQLSLEELVAKRFTSNETVVLISEGGAHAAQGWVLLRASGVEYVYFLRGGLGEWVDEVMSPAGASPEVAALSRYFGGVPRKGMTAAPSAGIEALKRRGC